MDPFPGNQSLKDFRGNCQTQVRISAVVCVEKDTPLDIESCNQPTMCLRLSNVTKSFWFFFSSNSFSSSLQTYWISSASPGYRPPVSSPASSYAQVKSSSTLSLCFGQICDWLDEVCVGAKNTFLERVSIVWKLVFFDKKFFC